VTVEYFPIELTVVPVCGCGEFYEVGWPDGEVLIGNLPERWPDLAGFLALLPEDGGGVPHGRIGHRAHGAS
jgi:hypothetical protein